tara:strand:+ start:5903 stop:6139 length:237 start_codon:yes stop_codon:yes gene_type:complete
MLSPLAVLITLPALDRAAISADLALESISDAQLIHGKGGLGSCPQRHGSHHKAIGLMLAIECIAVRYVPCSRAQFIGY